MLLDLDEERAAIYVIIAELDTDPEVLKRNLASFEALQNSCKWCGRPFPELKQEHTQSSCPDPDLRWRLQLEKQDWACTEIEHRMQGHLL